MGFLCCIFNDGHPLCHGSCHHHIDGGPHTDYVHINMASHKALCICLDQAMFDYHPGPQGTEALNMLVNGPKSNVTSPWQGHFRMLVFPQKSPQQIIGSPYLLDSFIFHHKAVNVPSVQYRTMTACPLYHDTDSLHGLQQHINVPYIRHILYIYSLIRHGGGSENRKRRILGPSDLHVTHKRIPALDRVLFHLSTPVPGKHLICYCSLRSQQQVHTK